MYVYSINTAFYLNTYVFIEILQSPAVTTNFVSTLQDTAGIYSMCICSVHIIQIVFYLAILYSFRQHSHQLQIIHMYILHINMRNIQLKAKILFSYNYLI